MLAATAVRSMEERQQGGVAVFPSPDGGMIVVRAPGGVPKLDIALILLGALPLALRRKYPIAVFWIVLISALKLESAPAALFFTAIIGAYTAAAYSPYRRAAIGRPLVA